jgi:hypothetical protein
MFQCSLDNLLEELPRSFVNLKSLSLHIPYCCLSSFLSIFCLVRKAPNLEVLDVEVIMLIVVVKNLNVFCTYYVCYFSIESCVDSLVSTLKRMMKLILTF